MSSFVTDGVLSRYLSRVQSESEASLEPAAVAFYAALESTGQVAPEIASSIIQELVDQRSHLKMIASENFSSLAVQLAQGNLLTDKYAEGFPNHRFYAGCDNVDAIESRAADLAKELFSAEHAYVQPHSGADANMVAFNAILAARVRQPELEKLGETNPNNVSRQDWQKIREAYNGQRLLAMDYYSGGHLTHGYRHNISAMMFDVHSYAVDPTSKVLDLDALRTQLHEVRPLILLAGYSAYPRLINFAKMRELADEVGAVFMVDMAHFAGLVAGKVFTGDFNPVPFADVVTSTTHKTLRGPRGGIVLCKSEFAPWVDKGCPLILGGPLPQMLAAKAVAFTEALRPSFQVYAHKIVENAQALAEACGREGLDVLTGGTDNHIVLVDVSGFGLTGMQAEQAVRSCGVTLNRNSLPFDNNGPWFTSGLRLGTPALTTLGMGADEMAEIAGILKRVLASAVPDDDSTRPGRKSRSKCTVPETVEQEARSAIADLLASYPLYPELDLSLFSDAR